MNYYEPKFEQNPIKWNKTAAFFVAANYLLVGNFSLPFFHVCANTYHLVGDS